MRLAELYANKLQELQMQDPPNDGIKGLSVEDRTKLVYDYVSKSIAKAKESGALAPGENLDALGITAQIMFESGNLTSGLSSKYNNFGGLKAGGTWKGKSTTMTAGDGKAALWRVYDTPEEGLDAQVNFYIENSRYRKNGVFKATNAKEHLEAVARAGYAGNESNYVANTMKMVESIPNRLKKSNPELLAQWTAQKSTMGMQQVTPEEIQQPSVLPFNAYSKLNIYPEINKAPYQSSSMVGMDDLKLSKQQQGIEDQLTEAIITPEKMTAPKGWFGSGKSMFFGNK
jgi:hypothetical protein